MFYCEPCRERNGWPKSSSRWRSVCEMCWQFSEDCNDIPSRVLPDPNYNDENSSPKPPQEPK